MCQRIFCSEYVYIAETEHTIMLQVMILCMQALKLWEEYAKDAWTFRNILYLYSSRLDTN